MAVRRPSDRSSARRRAAATSRLRLEALEPRQVLTHSLVAIGSDIGPASRPLLQLVEAETGTVVAETLAFEEAFRGGTRPAMANVDGRPGNEIVVGSGPGRPAEICVFTIDGVGENTTLRELPEFRLRPFGDSYFGGIAVAAGEVNGDGHADIAAAKSRGSEVSVFLSPAFGGAISQTPYQTFVPFGGGALGGAALAFADVGTFVNGSLVDGTKADGLAELAVVSGTGMKPVVKIYDLSGATARTVDSFTPFTPALVGGMSVAAGRYDANQIDDVIVTSGGGERQTGQLCCVRRVFSSERGRVYCPRGSQRRRADRRLRGGAGALRQWRCGRARLPRPVGDSDEPVCEREGAAADRLGADVVQRLPDDALRHQVSGDQARHRRHGEGGRQGDHPLHRLAG